MAYHQDVHSRTGQTPHERYHQEPRLVRQVDLGAVLGFFQQEVLRIVDGLRTCGWRTCSSPSIRACGAIGWSSSTILSPLPEVQFYTPRAPPAGAGIPTRKGQSSSAPARAARRAPHSAQSRRPAGRTRCRTRTSATRGSTIARPGKGTCGPCQLRPRFRPLLRPPEGRVRADRGGNGRPGRLSRPPRSRDRESAPASLRRRPPQPRFPKSCFNSKP